jgi:hypothetical protein
VNPMTPEDGTPETPAPPLRPAFKPAVALAPPPERVEPLNLARRPFLNSRPVVRMALLLWLLGLALLLVNLWQFLGYRGRSADKRKQIAQSEADIERLRANLARLQKTLDGFNLEAQNQKVDFLNKQIAERTFSWSQLLDRITERLPNDVRLNRLAPLTGEKAERHLQRTGAAGGVRRPAGASGDLVPLLITGESRNDEALLSFVDSLFRPPFTEANLAREEREEDGKTLKFEISVQYRPGPAAAGAAPGEPAPKIEELPMPGAAAPGARAAAPPAAPRATLHPQPPAGGKP